MFLNTRRSWSKSCCSVELQTPYIPLLSCHASLNSIAPCCLYLYIAVLFRDIVMRPAGR